MEGNRLALLLSVDDLRPAAGDDLNFDLRALNSNVSQSGASDWINLIADIEIQGGIVQWAEIQVRLEPVPC